MTPRFIIYFLVLTITLIYGILHVKQFKTPLRLLVYLLVVVWCSEITGRVVSYFFKTSLPVYHFLIPVQLSFYLHIYHRILWPQSKRKRLLNVMPYLAAGMSLLNSFILQDLWQFPSNALFLLSILLVTFSLLHFLAMLRQPAMDTPVQNPYFWFSTGNLVFYSITFFLFGYFNPIIKLAGKIPVWSMSIIFMANLFLYGVYFLGFRKAGIAFNTEE